MIGQVISSARITRIAGPVVGGVGLENVRLYDVVQVGNIGLVGEVIRLSKDMVTIQVYEDTSGIRVGEPIHSTGKPLVAQLGPGLLGQVYDGLQRPLKDLVRLSGNFIQRGMDASPLPQDILWQFTPCVEIGDQVSQGDILGITPESRTIKHLILVPPGCRGQVVEIRSGEYRWNDIVCRISPQTDHRAPLMELTLAQEWPVRLPRPIQRRLAPNEPLLTGTRIIDSLFPVSKGGAAIIPGGFGTGKTVVEQSLARWADADVVVYVGCGERGNEMTEVLEEFPTLEDPRSGAPLMERTVLIANTSNMPVAAREASIYTGITIAEYYRDMGYDVLILADSTSRWGEALREISGRLEEMPGEEGYPAYLAARLAEFYERSGRVVCLGSAMPGRMVRDQHKQPESPDKSLPAILSSETQRTGTVTVVGAVSPPGADFSEPMTQNSMRVVGTFWALDYDLSRRRHFPAINWTRSYSLYNLNAWYISQEASDWPNLVAEATALLQQEVELLEIVQLVGPDALAEAERAVLSVTRMLREDFLQQSSYHPVDRYCTVKKCHAMLKIVIDFHHRTQAALQTGIHLEQIEALPVRTEIARMKELSPDEAEVALPVLLDQVQHSFSQMGVEL